MDKLPYRVSTITAVGSINADTLLEERTTEPFISLTELYNILPIVEYGPVKTKVVGSGSRKQAANVQKANETKPSVPLQDGIIYVEYGKNTSDTNMKGFNPKKKTKRVPKNTKMSAINTVALRPNGLRNQNNKPFDNQVTLIYRILGVCEMNVKVFKNGVVQITGIREIEQGKMLIDKLIEIIKKCVDDHPNLVSDKTKLQNVGYTVHLINSDFSVGFSVKQDKLYRLMKRDYSAHECSYEPCIYPGVKITYYYNTNNDGVCRCDEYCGVKTRRNQSNMCKKITIAVFKSGNTIITGAKSYEHTNVAYKFIRQILEENRKEVEMIHHTELQQQLLNDTKQEKQGRVYLIHRSRFQYEITE